MTPDQVRHAHFLLNSLGEHTRVLTGLRNIKEVRGIGQVSITMSTTDAESSPSAAETLHTICSTTGIRREDINRAMIEGFRSLVERKVACMIAELQSHGVEIEPAP